MKCCPHLLFSSVPVPRQASPSSSARILTPGPASSRNHRSDLTDLPCLFLKPMHTVPFPLCTSFSGGRAGEETGPRPVLTLAGALASPEVHPPARIHLLSFSLPNPHPFQCLSNCFFLSTRPSDPPAPFPPGSPLTSASLNACQNSCTAPLRVSLQCPSFPVGRTLVMLIGVLLKRTGKGLSREL